MNDDTTDGGTIDRHDGVGTASTNSWGTPPIMMRRGQLGVVTEFDEPRGWGIVTSDSGECFPLHCTAIADGARTIAVGTHVRFGVGAGRMGRWEAADVSRVPSP